MRGRVVRCWVLGSVCLLFMLILYLSWRGMEHEELFLDNFSLKYGEEGMTIDFSLWKDDTEEKYFLFLPSWLNKSESEFRICFNDFKGKVYIDGIKYADGSYFKDDGSEAIHRLEVYGFLGDFYMDTTLQVLSSEQLPSVFVTVEDPERLLNSEEFENKKYLERGSLTMLDQYGDLLCQSNLSVFKVRGNLTSGLDKKPFTFTLEQPSSLLGMEPAVKWNLLANATDGSYIRNKIIRDLAYKSINAYEPQGEFAELYLNGVYQGLYLLTEAVEIGENRLEISPEDNWFIEMELDFRARDDETQMITDRGQTFIIHSDVKVSEEEKAQVLYRLNDIESALFAENGISSVSGKSLEQLIDLESFAEAWLIEELSGDHDAGITSQFLYASKEVDSLWYSGPVWDFDGIMTNVNTPMYAIPEALTTSIEMSRPEGDNNQNRWLAAMWKNPKFQLIVEEKYQSVFRENYRSILEYGVNEYVNQIQRSAVLDAFKWHKDRLSWFFTIPEGLHIPEEGAYDKYDTLEICTEVVKDFMRRKLQFLDKLWIEDKEFCIVEVRNSAPFLNQGFNQTLYYWVERGTAIQNLPHYETEEYLFEGYYDKDSDELITDGFIIEYHRILKGHWTGWDEE